MVIVRKNIIHAKCLAQLQVQGAFTDAINITVIILSVFDFFPHRESSIYEDYIYIHTYQQRLSLSIPTNNSSCQSCSTLLIL